MKVEIFSDGAARGNPNGPGGYGTIVRCMIRGKNYERELSKGYLRTTNNRMELMGVIAGLEILNRKCDVTVYSDSQYVVNAFNKGWIYGWEKKGYKNGNGMRLNFDLWKRLYELTRMHNVEFVWIKGHAGHPENERCDFLATSAADGDRLYIDVNYVNRTKEQ